MFKNWMSLDAGNGNEDGDGNGYGTSDGFGGESGWGVGFFSDHTFNPTYYSPDGSTYGYFWDEHGVGVGNVDCSGDDH